MSEPSTIQTSTTNYIKARGPLPPSLRLFKNAARSLRFENGTDLGRRVGVTRAIELMPDIKLKKTDRELMVLAGTTLKKLEGYRTGWGLSPTKTRDRIIALGMWRLRVQELKEWAEATEELFGSVGSDIMTATPPPVEWTFAGPRQLQVPHAEMHEWDRRWDEDSDDDDDDE